MSVDMNGLRGKISNEHIFDRAAIHLSKIDLVIGPGLLLDGNRL